jgi:hypothetical protein
MSACIAENCRLAGRELRLEPSPRGRKALGRAEVEEVNAADGAGTQRQGGNGNVHCETPSEASRKLDPSSR